MLWRTDQSRTGFPCEVPGSETNHAIALGKEWRNTQQMLEAWLATLETRRSLGNWLETVARRKLEVWLATLGPRRVLENWLE